MDVVLPNGRKITGIPDGTNKWAIAEKAITAGLAKPEDFGQESSSPVDGMSFYDRFMSGAGKAVTDIGRGIAQVGTQVGNKAGLVSDEAVNRNQATIDESRRLDAPLMSTGAGIAGNVAGNIAAMAIPGSVVGRGAQAMGMGRTAQAIRSVANPATFRAGAASGAIYGAAAPTATGESRAANAALGAAAGLGGQAITKGVSRLAQPVANARSWAVERLRQAGVPMDLAQRTQSAPLQQVRSALNNNPLTSGGQRRLSEAQRSAFSRAVLKTIGADADAATSDVMNAARTRIGGVFDDVANKTGILYDDALESSVSELIEGASKELSEQQMGVISRQVENILSKAAENNGTISGRAFQPIKESLDRLSRGADPSVGYWARSLREVLHDGLERSASTADVLRLQNARQQYANLKAIEGAISKDGTGVISPLRLSNALYTKANRWRSVYGRGDQTLVELAEAGRQVLPETLPDSGTAGRLMTSAMMSGGFGGGAYALTGDPEKAMLAAGVGAGGPMAIQYLMNRAPNRARYLAEGLRQGLARTALQAPTQSPVIAPASRQALTAYLLSQREAVR